MKTLSSVCIVPDHGTRAGLFREYGMISPGLLGLSGGFEPDHRHGGRDVAGGNRREPLINRRESPGFFTLQTQDAKQMIVCEQGNGELAVGVRQPRQGISTPEVRLHRPDFRRRCAPGANRSCHEPNLRCVSENAARPPCR